MDKEIQKIKEEICDLEFDGYPIEIDDDLGNWHWTDDALDILAWYIYDKIKKSEKGQKDK